MLVVSAGAVNCVRLLLGNNVEFNFLCFFVDIYLKGVTVCFRIGWMTNVV